MNVTIHNEDKVGSDIISELSRAAENTLARIQAMGRIGELGVCDQPDILDVADINSFLCGSPPPHESQVPQICANEAGKHRCGHCCCHAEQLNASIRAVIFFKKIRAASCGHTATKKWAEEIVLYHNASMSSLSRVSLRKNVRQHML